MDHCSCARGRKRRDALARNDDGMNYYWVNDVFIWRSLTDVSQQITAERALSTPPRTPKLLAVPGGGWKTYEDIRPEAIIVHITERQRQKER